MSTPIWATHRVRAYKPLWCNIGFDAGSIDRCCPTGRMRPPLISFKLCTFSAIRIFWKASKTFGARKLVCSHKKSLRLSSHFGGLWVPNVQLLFLPKAKGQNIQPYLHSLTHWRTEVGGESSM